MRHVATPLYLAAPFAAEDPYAFVDEASKVRPSAFYTRYGNPGTRLVEDEISAVEGGEAALMLASGMAALSTLLITLCSSGSHVVAQRRCYGGTRALLSELGERFSIEISFVEQADPSSFLEAIRPETKLVLMESPSNPLLGLTDLGGVGRALKERGVVSAVDSTLASPINQQPLTLGVDVVMHSATKYMSGHSDATAGVLIGRESLINACWKTSILLGCHCSPHDAWLVGRGLKSLRLRMDAHNKAGLALAQWLEGRREVADVFYPGLGRDQSLFETQMTGGGGVVSFRMHGSPEQADGMLSRLEEVQLSASFGSFGSLATRPAAMWTGLADSERLQDIDVAATLIRIGVGVGDVEPLIRDLEQAFAAIYP